jgi:hypothetical protein
MNSLVKQERPKKKNEGAKLMGEGEKEVEKNDETQSRDFRSGG